MGEQSADPDQAQPEARLPNCHVAIAEGDAAMDAVCLMLGCGLFALSWWLVRAVARSRGE